MDVIRSGRGNLLTMVCMIAALSAYAGSVPEAFGQAAKSAGVALPVAASGEAQIIQLQFPESVELKVLVDYVEPDDVEGGRRLSQGTFAIQAHDPRSKVLLRNIMVRPLPDDVPESE